MKKIKTIVFDWDGTIVDSIQLKQDVWSLIFPRHTKAYSVIQKLLPELKFSTRLQILDKVFNALDITGFSKEKFVAKYSDIYKNEVEKGILRNGFLPGAKEALEELHTKIPLYLNSATPFEPLLSVVKKIDAEKYFKGIYGRSKAQENYTQYDLKVENLQDIAKKENFDRKEILMVGDAEADEKTAHIFGCKFFKVGQNTNLMVDLPKEV